MSNMTKIALSAAIILSAAFSALTAANAGTITRRRATRPVAAWRPMIGTEALSRGTGTIEAATIAPLAT